MGWWPWSGSEQDEAKAKWEAEPWGEYYGSFPGAYCIDNRKPPTEWSKAKLMAKTTAKQQDVAVQDQGQQGGGSSSWDNVGEEHYWHDNPAHIKKVSAYTRGDGSLAGTAAVLDTSHKETVLHGPPMAPGVSGCYLGYASLTIKVSSDLGPVLTSAASIKVTTISIYKPFPTFSGQEVSTHASLDRGGDDPMFLFAVVSTRATISGTEGSYQLLVGPKRYMTVLWGCRRASSDRSKHYYLIKGRSNDFNNHYHDGNCIAKVQQLDDAGKELEADIAPGVDPLAMWMLVSGLMKGRNMAPTDRVSDQDDAGGLW